MPRREEPSRGLLDPVAKMLRLPFGTPEFIDRIVTSGVNQAGRQTLYLLITTWDAAGGGPFAASAIASTGMAKTTEIVQNMFVGPVFNPVLKMLGVGLFQGWCGKVQGARPYGTVVVVIATYTHASLANRRFSFVT